MFNQSKLKYIPINSIFKRFCQFYNQYFPLFEKNLEAELKNTFFSIIPFFNDYETDMVFTADISPV